MYVWLVAGFGTGFLAAPEFMCVGGIWKVWSSKESLLRDLQIPSQHPYSVVPKGQVAEFTSPQGSDNWLFAQAAKLNRTRCLSSYLPIQSLFPMRVLEPANHSCVSHVRTCYQSWTPRMRLDLGTTGNIPLHLEGLRDRGQAGGG